MSQSQQATGIPTRAVHEAGLKTLAAREAVAGVDNPSRGAHRKLQSAVNTYFDALRPYLLHESEGQKYYRGELPSESNPTGTAVFDVDEYTETFPEERFQPIPDLNGRKETVEYIIEQLDFSREKVVVGVEQQDENTIAVQIREYQIGLVELESLWAQRQTVTEKNDWLPDYDKTTQKLKLVDLGLLVKASRFLDEAARELGFMPARDDREKNTLS